MHDTRVALKEHDDRHVLSGPPTTELHAIQTPYCFCFFPSQKTFVTRIWRVRIINVGIYKRE
ncbi:unnamed protein product [Ixodes pacificus]